MTVIEIDIISDIVCVWCYIGKRTLERAISMYQKTYPGGKNDVFSIMWRPYFLSYNNYPGASSVEKSELAEKKFESWTPEKKAAVSNRVNQIARSVGINFSFKGKIGRTQDAHRLIHLSQQSQYSDNVQDKLVEKLFEAYHELEKDISDPEVLREFAIEAGIDRVDIDEHLNSPREAEIVDKEAQKYRQMTNSGVPKFIIQGVYEVDGAQDLQEFFEAFIKVKETETAR